MAYCRKASCWRRHKVRLLGVNRLLPLPAEELTDDGAVLSRILKSLRRLRGLTTREMAQRMNMGHRNYQLFEAGRGTLNLTRLQRFADVTGSDAWGILLALAFRTPELALRCAENKVATAMIMAAMDFQKECGADLANLDARITMSRLDAAFGDLTKVARGRRFPERDPLR